MKILKKRDWKTAICREKKKVFCEKTKLEVRVAAAGEVTEERRKRIANVRQQKQKKSIFRDFATIIIQSAIVRKKLVVYNFDRF